MKITEAQLRKIIRKSLTEEDGRGVQQDLSKPIPIDELQFVDEEGYGAMMFPGVGYSYSVRKKDFEAILNANKEMNELIGKLKTDFAELDKRFNKKNRDVGLLAIEKTKAVERITNSASDKANRCIEIASGSPLTEKEINATKKSEINTECPSIANPNYIPY